MWKLSSCEVQGRGHIKNQIPCQDKTKVSFANGTYIISLADGAGSAKLSHYGALCVVNSITDMFTDHFDELYEEVDGRQVKVTIMEHLLANINEKANELECTIKDLASTLLVVAVKDEKFIIVHIGDGVIGYLDDTGLKVASAPSNGEHANETYFVTSRDAITSMKLFKGECKNKSGFVIMSDGTEQSLYNKRTNTLSKAVYKLLQRNVLIEKEVMQLQLKETFENIISTNTHDDCSIALLSRDQGMLHSIYDLSFDERCAVYQIRNEDRHCKKRVERYDEILRLLTVPHTCKMISKKIHLRPEHTKKQLSRMLNAGLIKKTNGVYHV